MLTSVGRLLKQDTGIIQGMDPGIIQPACRFHFQDIRNQEPTWPGTVVSRLSTHSFKCAFFGKKFRVQDLLVEH
jgi:hypothetical protein